MAIQEYLVVNKQDLVKDKLFHLIELFQLINIAGIRYNGNRNKAEFQRIASQSCFVSDPFLFYKSVNLHCYFSKLH